MDLADFFSRPFDGLGAGAYAHLLASGEVNHKAEAFPGGAAVLMPCSSGAYLSKVRQVFMGINAGGSRDGVIGGHPYKVQKVVFYRHCGLQLDAALCIEVTLKLFYGFRDHVSEELVGAELLPFLVADLIPLLDTIGRAQSGSELKCYLRA